MTTETTSPAPSEPAAPPPSAPVTAPASTSDTQEALGGADQTPADGSIREHASKGRHRAESHRARGEDVPRIRELTKHWRTAEEKIAHLTRELESVKAVTAPKQADPRETVFKGPTPGEPATFDEPEPTIDDYADAPDPLAAWVKAMSRHDRKREAFEAKQAESTTTTAQAIEGQKAALAEIQRVYGERLQSFISQTPDFVEKLQTYGDLRVPDLAGAAIQLDDNGPQLLYALLQQPVLMHELFLITEGKPVTQGTVETTRRWLAAKVQAATPQRVTGSAALPPHVPAPRPPTPVRTSAIKSSDRSSDGLSILEHAKAFRR